MKEKNKNIKKKVGLLFSYLNAEKEIPRALDNWYPHIDHIIAIDGRYQTPQSPEMKAKNYPDYSTDCSEHILKTRYPDKITHERFKGTQMEKRQRCLDIAGELGCDYAIVWDSDEYIHPDYNDWNKFFKQLELTEYWDDQIFKMRCWIPDATTWPKQYNAVPDNYWMRYVRIHKDPGNQRYVLNHYTFTTKDITNDEINEWDFKNPTQPGLAPLENPYCLQANIVLDGIRIATDRRLRTPDQLTYGDGWAWQVLHEENWRHTVIPAAKHAGFRIPYENDEYYFNEQGQRIVYLPKGKEMITPLIIRDGKLINNPDSP